MQIRLVMVSPACWLTKASSSCESCTARPATPALLPQSQLICVSLFASDALEQFASIAAKHLQFKRIWILERCQRSIDKPHNRFPLPVHVTLDDGGNLIIPRRSVHMSRAIKQGTNF